MKTSAILLSALGATLAAAAPVAEVIEKRDMVYQTAIVPVVETVVITTTITLAPGEPTPPADSQKYTPPPSYQQQPDSPPPQKQADTQPQPQPQQPQQPQQPPAAPAVQPVQQPTPTPTPTPPTTPPPATNQGTGSSGSTGGGSSYAVKTLPGASHDDGCSQGTPCEGQATYYSTGLGSCGTTSTDQDMIFAVSHLMMGTVSNGNELCGRKAMITGPSGKSQVATMVDKCMGCADGPTNIDLSPGLFNAIGGGDGVIKGVKWYWM